MFCLVDVLSLAVMYELYHRTIFNNPTLVAEFDYSLFPSLVKLVHHSPTKPWFYLLTTNTDAGLKEGKRVVQPNVCFFKVFFAPLL